MKNENQGEKDTNKIGLEKAFRRNIKQLVKKKCKVVGLFKYVSKNNKIKISSIPSNILKPINGCNSRKSRRPK